jgi:RNA polymerase sigma factor (sigma-70 family)
MDAVRRQRSPGRPPAAGPPASLVDLDDVARLYRDEAARVRRLVHANVVAPPALIEDACQIAWCRLLVHRARLRPDSARAWLVRVAIHEVLRSLHREQRMSSLEELRRPTARTDDDPADRASAPAPDLLEDLVEHRVRLASLRALPDRQRRLLWLQGLGLSYREMAGQTGMTRRTVERQLLRARSSLAKVGA